MSHKFESYQFKPQLFGEDAEHAATFATILSALPLYMVGKLKELVFYGDEQSSLVDNPIFRQSVQAVIGHCEQKVRDELAVAAAKMRTLGLDN